MAGFFMFRYRKEVHGRDSYFRTLMHSQELFSDYLHVYRTICHRFLKWWLGIAYKFVPAILLAAQSKLVLRIPTFIGKREVLFWACCWTWCILCTWCLFTPKTDCLPYYVMFMPGRTCRVHLHVDTWWLCYGTVL